MKTLANVAAAFARADIHLHSAPSKGRQDLVRTSVAKPRHLVFCAREKATASTDTIEICASSSRFAFCKNTNY